MSKFTPSGAGTRPTTDGTVDNMGAGESFNPGSSAHGPAPKEKISDNKRDAISVETDGSAAFGLTEDASDVLPDKTYEKPSDQERPD